MINETEFIHKISTYLEGFKELGHGKFNFRCNCCGDGDSGYKTRAWFLEKDSYVFYCHNCSLSMSFPNYLKLKFPEVYKEYVLEKLKETKWKGKESLFFKEDSNIDLSSHNIVKSFLKPCTDHEDVIKYLEGRKIPSNRYKDIFVIENFKDLNYVDKYKDSIFHEEKRIVLPIYNNKGLINGIISRSISPSAKKRYINLKFYDDVDIFGLYDSNGDYKIDLNKKIYAVEGAFDSMMLDNAVAVNTSDLLRIEKAIPESLLKHLNIVYVSDNEPRNYEIMKVYKKIIDSGNKIVIYPSYIIGKDINEMIINNSNTDIMTMLSENTFNGIGALVRFNQFKKV